MNSEKIGKLILQLRKELRLTQKNLAQKLYVSDKAISKWERGVGCPDISLISQLSEIFGVNIKDLLEGEKSLNAQVNGDLRKCHFYYCENCRNVITSFSECSLSCCGKILNPLIAQNGKDHSFQIEQTDDHLYLSSPHEMSKEHYISFVAHVRNEAICINKLYPEQMAETFFPQSIQGGTYYFHCTCHGLWQQKC